MKIVVAGYGPVGQAVHTALNSHDALDVYIDDPLKGFNFDPNPNLTPIEAVVVCVATPMNDDGSCNIDNICDVFEKYGAVKYLIKSAVDPVFLKMQQQLSGYRVTYSPEFLASSNINRDPTKEFLEQTFAIYGGSDCRWWDELFRPLLPKLHQVKYGTLEQASFLKYVENSFLATKVTFFNEMYSIYNSLGFEGFDHMIDLLCCDPRIGKSHTQVPGSDGKFGYGGHCFPKDIAALRSLTKDTPLLDAVVDINEENRNA